MKNNNGIALAGLAVAAYFLLKKDNTSLRGVEDISGITDRRKVIKNYLSALGLPEGHAQLEKRWSKMSTQELIVDAFRNGILIVTENPFLRSLLYQKFNFNAGIEPTDNAYKQNINRWQKMTLKQIIDEASRYGIMLLDDTIYKDPSGKRYYPQTQREAWDKSGSRYTLPDDSTE